MPVSDLDIANGLFWLCGYGPSDERGRDLADRLNLRHTRDQAELRAALLAAPEVRGLHRDDIRHPRQPRLDLDRPRLAFLHMPKCGGTTLHAILARHFDAARICPERFNGLRGRRLDDLALYTLFSGHFDLESCQALPGRATRIVTMLREPRARLVSLYDFLRIHRPEHEPATASMVALARALPIEAFFAHPLIRRHPSIRDAMTVLLTQPHPSLRWEAIDATLDDADPVMADPGRAAGQAFAALQACAAFGILEAFDASVALIGDSLGLPLDPIAPQQVTDEMRTRPHLHFSERPEVTDALLATLDELTRADRLLYGQATALFAARTAASPRPVPPAATFGPMRPIPLDRLHPLEARRDGSRIVASGVAGALAAGPYMALPNGRYRIACHFTRASAAGPDPAAITINVWHNRGLARCTSVDWTGASPGLVDVTLPFDVTDLECVIQVGPDSGLDLVAMELAAVVDQDGPAPAP